MERTASAAALLVLLAAASWWDLRTRRIPNRLTVPALGAALALRLLDPAGPAVASLAAGVEGALLGLAFALPLFALRAMGGGDAKLLMATGAFLGPVALVPAMVLGAVVAGALGLLIAA